MKLLTKEILNKIPDIKEQESSEDPIVYIKFFHPMNNWYWFATEYNPEEKIFFGLVCGFYNEFGYFSLEELESIKIMGLSIERDKWFEPKLISEVIKEYRERTTNKDFPLIKKEI
jgi:hypothetical protein